MLQDNQNADLLEYGRSTLPNAVDRQFFSASFADPLYRATKLALVSRLTDIIRDPVLRRFTCHGSSFDLGGLLDGGKVIVVQFDPSQQGKDTITAIGQLLTAAILSHVLGRPPSRRYPIHLFVDEAQYFVSRTISEILGESRKFGLYLTLATQRLESLDTALQDAVLGNVGTIWIGSSRHNTGEKLSRETDISASKIRSLPNLQFFQSCPGKPAKRISLRYLGKRYLMKPLDWRRVQKDQAELYYQDCKRNADQSKPIDTWNPKFL